jgi:hypothetical protein
VLGVAERHLEQMVVMGCHAGCGIWAGNSARNDGLRAWRRWDGADVW